MSYYTVILTKEIQMVHYTSTIIAKYRVGKLDTWVAWIKRGRTPAFCQRLDAHIAETLDEWFYG